MMKRNVVYAVMLLLCCVPFFAACSHTAQPETIEPIPVITAAPTPSPTPIPTPTPIPAPPIVLNMEEGSCYGGGVIQLVAYENPGMLEMDDAVWTSSDETVAVVESYGVVIGLSSGTAVITAKNDAGESACCTVTVTSERPQPRERIALTSTDCRRGKEKLKSAEVRRIQALADALSADAVGERIALSALRYVGNYYGVREGNIDCSMLLLYACLDNGGFLPRRSDWQAAALTPRIVSREDLRAGDFLFFAYYEEDLCSCRTAPVCTRHLGVHHAAIYLGEAKGIHYLIEASSVVGRLVVRAWDGSDSHAGLKLVEIARPDDGTVFDERDAWEDAA